MKYLCVLNLVCWAYIWWAIEIEVRGVKVKRSFRLLPDIGGAR